MTKCFDLLISSHPIFKLFPNDLYMFEQCDMINEYGNSIQYFVAFHISGIFLLESKTFQRNYSIVKTIPTHSIFSLIVTKDSILISFLPQNFIELKFQNHLRLAALICTVKSLIYDNPNLHLNFEIDESIRKEFDSIDLSNIFIKNNAANCFLGMFLYVKTFNEKDFKQIYDLLNSNNLKTLKIDQNMFNNIYFNEFIGSISLSTETENIIIENIELGNFAVNLKQMIVYSETIKSLYFKNVTFQRNFESFKDLFNDQNQLIRIESISFQNCKFIANETSIFFNSFSECLSDIKKLKVDGCFLTNFTLDCIFQSLFFSNCFHSLEVINFSNVSLPDDLTTLVVQLLGCGWVLQKKCLSTVVLRNCAINIGEFLSQINKFDCGIVTLDLGFNIFQKCPVQVDLKHLEELILDHCTFTSESLVHFFTLLEKGDSENLITVDLSRIIADDECLSYFYKNSGSLIIPKLNGLLWNDNKITTSTI